jgi:2-polyprenyl-3-methyl-5-hydroxy-6-metoxy-1,4-benzoquinol methylase
LQPLPPEIELVCPKCHGELGPADTAYLCAACGKRYPILHGIPDFRLRPDPYLTLEEERAKAQRLAEHPAQSFAELLDFYYTITDDVSPELALRYKAYNHDGPELATYGLQALELRPEQTLLDAGCGSGGALLAAQGRCAQLIGVDIALRWLVICKRRLEENGVQATLICADVEALPFRPESFERVLGSDLLENVHDVPKSMASLARVMSPDARLWITGSNKYCLGPHPTTRTWAIGCFPRAMRSWILRRLRGVDSLRFIQLITPLGLRSRGRQVGLGLQRMGPKRIPPRCGAQLPQSDRLLIRIYRFLSRLPLASQALLFFGPSFEMLFHKHAPTKTKA